MSKISVIAAVILSGDLTPVKILLIYGESQCIPVFLRTSSAKSVYDQLRSTSAFFTSIPNFVKFAFLKFSSPIKNVIDRYTLYVL